jgi:alkylated DNA nucleotide flippase Atl1
VAEELSSYRAHVNGRILHLTARLFDDPRVEHIDLTDAYRRLNDRPPTPRGARAGSFQRVTPLDFDRATAFVEAVPRGRWTAYKDVAAAAGNAQGAQAIGEWLRRRGDEVPHAYRVLRSDGFVADAFRPAGPGLPSDSASVRDLLRSEGVDVDPRGRASPAQRFSPEGWLQR